MQSSIINSRGFTFIEFLITVAIFMLLIGGTLLSLSYFYNDSQIDVTTHRVTENIRRAQAQAISRYQNTPWGIYLDPALNTYTFFSGTSYASRNPTFDEVNTLPPSLSFGSINLGGGGTQIIFNQRVGETGNSGSFQIVGQNGQVTTITINGYGQIDQQ